MRSLAINLPFGIYLAWSLGLDPAHQALADKIILAISTVKNVDLPLVLRYASDGAGIGFKQSHASKLRQRHKSQPFVLV